jgi:hypothetical protein
MLDRAVGIQAGRTTQPAPGTPKAGDAQDAQEVT